MMPGMKADIRKDPLYTETEALIRRIRAPGSGLISDASEIDVAPDGTTAVFSGTVIDTLDGVSPTRICSISLATGETHVKTFGPHSDRLPKFSPCGRWVAFLSDRVKRGDFQLFLLDPVTGGARATPTVSGWVEYLQWSPEGTRILLGVAGHGADVAGGQGAIRSEREAASLPSWMPHIETGYEEFRRRTLWVYDLSSNDVRELQIEALNVWEAVWCGTSRIATIASGSPHEGSWYSARLYLIETSTGNAKEVFASADQLGVLSAPSSGQRIAVVEAVCSDRGLVAGAPKVIDLSSGNVTSVDTHGVDCSCLRWASDDRLLCAGHRRFQSVVGIYDCENDAFSETWSSDETTTGGTYITATTINDRGDFAIVGEGFRRSPEVALVRGGGYQAIRSFDVGYAAEVEAVLGRIEQVRWQAAYGLEVEGSLLCPREVQEPYPLVMQIHGGPVWQWRPAWLARARGISMLMLLKAGFALFLPNPRGSAGRGREFIQKVRGDINGADSRDLLSGLDQLVRSRLADPKRLGVTGVSYGGNLTAWLITQDNRFRAAVAVSPHTNQITQYLLSNIPQFLTLFLGGHFADEAAKYLERSPIMDARRVKTPTLTICGARDACTPPEEAKQFHNALIENNVPSVLVTYPEEGHGVQKWPAVIDATARIVQWFQENLLERA